MAQDLNNPPPPPPAPTWGNSTPSSEIGHSGGSDVGEWLSGAWGTFSGRNDYRAPENVFNPLKKYDPSQSWQSRGMQRTTTFGMDRPNAYYEGLMAGSAPSLAQLQQRQGIAQAQRLGMQSASGARGIDRAAAFRQAQNNASDLAARGAISGGQLRLQEQQLGAQGLSQGLQAQNNMASTTRQQDIGEQQGLMSLQNQAQANLNTQYGINAGITNANAANQQRAAGGLVQMGAAALAALASDVRNKEDIRSPGIISDKPGEYGELSRGLSSLSVGGYGGSPQTSQSPMFDAATLANVSSAFGGGQQQGTSGSDAAMSAIPVVGSMMSDENSKEALHGVHPYQFRYKDAFAHKMASEAAQGAARNAYELAFQDAKMPRMGVMAQDLARTPEGAQTIRSTPEGLQIEGKRALGFMLANQADFNERLSALERGKR